jgi:hypothetical protein
MRYLSVQRCLITKYPLLPQFSSVQFSALRRKKGECSLVRWTFCCRYNFGFLIWGLAGIIGGNIICAKR